MIEKQNGRIPGFKLARRASEGFADYDGLPSLARRASGDPRPQVTSRASQPWDHSTGVRLGRKRLQGPDSLRTSGHFC